MQLEQAREIIAGVDEELHAVGKLTEPTEVVAGAIDCVVDPVVAALILERHTPG